MNYRKAAYLTLEDRTSFFVYDQLTFEPLRQLGWEVVEIPWTQTGVDWSQFDTVVIRSTWDYQSQPQRFLQVLENIEASGTRLLNPLGIVRWNLDKVYLRELEQRGVSIVPTAWQTGVDEKSIADLFDEFDSSGLVIKPTIGANADDTFSLKRSKPDDWQTAIKIFPNRPAMLQPFIQSIVDEGEFSLFYFGGEYSHAILKTPKQHDFRVQEEHGGTMRSIEASPDLKTAGQQVIDSIEEVLLYARVDLVRLRNGTPALIEVELIEPSLYFGFDQQSPVRFAEALDSMFGN